MNNELKVSFYLKRENRLEKGNDKTDVTYPTIGESSLGTASPNSAQSYLS